MIDQLTRSLGSRGSIKRAERRYGNFECTMKLPYQVDGEKAEAILKNGVLTVSVPKLPGQQAEGKKIAICKE
jgi:HSP20 family protein